MATTLSVRHLLSLFGVLALVVGQYVFQHKVERTCSVELRRCLNVL